MTDRGSVFNMKVTELVLHFYQTKSTLLGDKKCMHIQYSVITLEQLI